MYKKHITVFNTILVLSIIMIGQAVSYGEDVSYGAYDELSDYGEKNQGYEDKSLKTLNLKPDPGIEKRIKSKVFPIPPANLHELNQDMLDTHKAAQLPLPGKLINRTIRISLQPGDRPHIINTTSGMSTSVSFIDMTGKPWPIAYFNLGNSKAFAVEAPGFQKGKLLPGYAGNTLLISPNGFFTNTNITILLAQESTPITIVVREVRDNTDLHVGAEVLGRGPMAARHTGGGSEDFTVISSLDRHTGIIDNILDGLPPKGAVQMQVKDKKHGDVEAWTMGDKLYLRTTMSVLFPLYTEIRRGESGLRAYALSSRVHAVGMIDDSGESHMVVIAGPKKIASMKQLEGDSGG